MTETYISVDHWLSAPEGYGLRIERLSDEFPWANLDRLKGWLEAAWKCGAEAVIMADKTKQGMHLSLQASFEKPLYSEADCLAMKGRAEKAEAEIERTIRNRDMYRGQCDRQAKELETFRTAMSGAFCLLFLDGRNEHGSHVLPSFPKSFDAAESEFDEQAEAILAAAEALGFKTGEDHVWAEFTWVSPQIGEYGRVELAGYWDFSRINKPMSDVINRAALKGTPDE